MTARPFDADRERLYRLVDRWIDFLNEEESSESGLGITVALIGGIIASEEDGEPSSAPSFMCESTHPHVQVGVARMLARMIEDSALGVGPED